MTQIVRSVVLSLSMVATAVVVTPNAFAADKPSTCLQAYRQASHDYRHTSDRDVEAMQTAKYLTGGAGLVFVGAAAAKAKMTGGIIGGLMVGAAGYSYYSACTHLEKLENASMILSVYENIRNTGGATDIPEGKDLLMETFADESISSNCSLFSHESLSESQREAKLSKVSDEAKQQVLGELVKRMESGALCDDQNSPKALGDIVAELKNYEQTKTKAIF